MPGRPALRRSENLRRVGNGPGVGEDEADDDGEQAELLEAEHDGQAPHAGGEQAQHDRAPRRAVGPLHFGMMPAQQPDGHVGHRDADEVGEIGRSNQPDRVANEQENDRHAGGEHGGRPRGVGAGALGEKFGQQAVFGQLGQRAGRTGQRGDRAVKHVHHHEPDRGAFRGAAEHRGKRRTEHLGEILAERLGPQGAQPDERKDDEIEGGHARAGVHCTRHVFGGIDRLADVAGGLFERRGSKSDQIKAGHHARDATEPAGEGQGKVEGEGLLPVHVTVRDRDEGGQEGEGGRDRGDGHGHAHDPFDATEVDDGEKHHDARREGRHGNPRQVPLLDGRGR